MTNSVNIVETALLLLVAFLVGCIIGYLLRAWTAPGRGPQRLDGRPSDAEATGLVAGADPVAAAGAGLALEPTSVAAAETPLPDPSPEPEPEPVATAGVEPPDPGPEPAPVAEPEPVVAPEIAADGPPPGLAGPRGGKPDDLKIIKGIGPKIESSLHGLGVWHFDQIAAWTPEQVAYVDTHLSFRGRIGREQWVEQAKRLAAGG